MNKVLLLLLLICAAPTHAAGLSAQERRIAAAVQAHQAEHLLLLEQLVNINSGTLNPAGVRQVAELLRPRFEALGMRVRWLPMDPVGRAGHLLAEQRGGRGARLLLIAHLDTVFEADSPFQRYQREGDTAAGPGVNDIKGGIVVILAALQALHEAGALSRSNITVFLSGDEERPGQPLAIARRDLLAAGAASDIALDFEAMYREQNQDTLHLGRRGSLSWKLWASGDSGHSAGVGRGAGYGAVYELVRIIDAFRTQLPEPDLSYNAALIAGGSSLQLDAQGVNANASGKPNIIAGQAYATGDLRALSPEQVARVQERMRGIVAQHLDRTQAHIEFDEAYPPMAPSAGSAALFEQMQRINRDLGLGELRLGDPANRGAGDISFVGQLPGLVGMGLAGGGAHAVGEYADLRSLVPQAQRAALLMLRLSKPQP